MPQLDSAYYISQLFWLVIFFLSIYLFITRPFFYKMTSLMSDREKFISDNIIQAEINLLECSKIESQINLIHSSIKNDIHNIRKKIDDDVKNLIETSRQYAISNIQKNKEEALKEMELITRDFLSEVNTASEALSYKFLTQIRKV